VFFFYEKVKKNRKSTFCGVFIDKNSIATLLKKCTELKIVSERMASQEALYLAASEVKTSSAV
jgi:hypothetical protein